jgi:hypothetical protein
MKKIAFIKIICVVGLFLTCAGCSDLLDKAPYGALSDATFYKTEADAIMAVNAVYDRSQHSYIYSTFALMSNNIWSDEAEKGGGGPADTPMLEELNSFEVQLSNGVVSSSWSALYQGIFRANKALEMIEPMSLSLKDRLLGETKFLRALFYYNLNIRYNGVPLVTSTSTDGLESITRSSAQAVWAVIETDLQDAIKVLPASYSGEDIGRATKGSAQGLLARVYLFTKEWQKSADLYSEIINSGSYHLMDNFADNFLNKEGDNLPESVFEIQFTTGTGDNGNSFEYHGWVRPRDQPQLGWGGNGFVIPTKSLVDAFESNDVRRKATVLVDGDEIFGTVYSSSWSPYTGYNTRKYIWGPEVIHQEAEANMKVIRYSEVLLGYAEAVFNGAAGKANITGLQALNQVRKRAGLDDISALTFEAIVHERQVELALEGFRFYDLVRWGIAKEVLGDKFDVNHDEYLPIPLNEILMNPNLEQNPGY